MIYRSSVQFDKKEYVWQKTVEVRGHSMPVDEPSSQLEAKKPANHTSGRTKESSSYIRCRRSAEREKRLFTKPRYCCYQELSSNRVKAEKYSGE